MNSKLIGSVATAFVICVWFEVIVIKDTVLHNFYQHHHPCHILYTFYERDFKNY